MKFNLQSVPSYEFDNILNDLEVFKKSKLRYLIIQEISALIGHEQRSENNDSYKLGAISQLLDFNALIQVDLENDIKKFMKSQSGSEENEEENENKKLERQKSLKDFVLAKKK